MIPNNIQNYCNRIEKPQLYSSVYEYSNLNVSAAFICQIAAYHDRSQEVWNNFASLSTIWFLSRLREQLKISFKVFINV